MNILILGGGGREHALAWAIRQNPKCDRLIVAPGNADLRCTTVSVASHSLYERSDPCIQPGPGGVNDHRHLRVIDPGVDRLECLSDFSAKTE